MKLRHALYIGLLIAILVVAGCTSPNPTAAPGTVSPADTPATAAATVAPDAGGVAMGFTEDGLPYRGDPDAPVTLYEYSDFQ